MRPFSAVLACALVPAAAWAGDFGPGARGTTTANFLKLGAGARAAGMGEAFTAVADDATALYWNPGALVRVEGQAATLMHAPYLDSSYFDYAGYARRLRRGGVLGLGVHYFSAGSIDETDATGTDVGSFKPNDAAVSAGYAREVHGFGVGIAAKLVQSKIVDKARTAALDAGVLSPALMEGRLRFGLAASNLGGKMKFDEAKEDLPLVIRAGGAFKLRKDWTAALDLGFPRDGKSTLAVGMEHSRALRDGRSLSGRIGYSTRNSDVGGFEGLTLGLGCGSRRIGLDYAFVPLGDLGTTHRISLSARF